MLIRITGMAVIARVVGRLILKSTSGPDGVEKMMVEVMPKVMDAAFGKLAPEKRQGMLARFRSTLAGLEEQYGTRTEHTRSRRSQPLHR